MNELANDDERSTRFPTETTNTAAMLLATPVTVAPSPAQRVESTTRPAARPVRVAMYIESRPVAPTPSSEDVGNRGERSSQLPWYRRSYPSTDLG